MVRSLIIACGTTLSVLHAVMPAAHAATLQTTASSVLVNDGKGFQPMRSGVVEPGGPDPAVRIAIEQMGESSQSKGGRWTTRSRPCPR